MGSETLSITDISDLLNEPGNRVRYMITKYRIKPVKQIGNTRVFDKSVVDRVKKGLFNMQIQQGKY